MAAACQCFKIGVAEDYFDLASIPMTISLCSCWPKHDHAGTWQGDSAGPATTARLKILPGRGLVKAPPPKPPREILRHVSAPKGQPKEQPWPPGLEDQPPGLAGWAEPRELGAGSWGVASGTPAVISSFCDATKQRRKRKDPFSVVMKRPTLPPRSGCRPLPSATTIVVISGN